MDVFLKVAAGALITAILGLVLSKERKDYALLLSLAVCCMIMATAASLFDPILQLLDRIKEIGTLDYTLFHLLLRVTGIGLLSQIAGMICADAENQTLTKALEIITTVVILWLMIPLVEEVLTIVESILGDI